MINNTIDHDAIQARLGKPGAGLPLLQRLVLKYFLGPYISTRDDWAGDIRDFDAVNAKTFAAIEGLEDNQLTTRVLVPKQTGLEDSSRYWSVAMTLDHICIVGEGVRDIILSLSNGVVPNRKVDTAKVKPECNEISAVARFRDFATLTMSDIDARLGDKDALATLEHPWFGPFTLRQWHWLLAVHGDIHLRQLKAIRKRLYAPNPAK